MYATKDKKIIDDRSDFVDSRGIKYPRSFPKDEISELTKVKECPKPEGKIIENFYIDDNFSQVWVARDKTKRENKSEIKDKLTGQLNASDLSMARVAEDLIVILLDKGTISESDIPKIVLEKINSRKQLRSELSNA